MAATTALVSVTTGVMKPPAFVFQQHIPTLIQPYGLAPTLACYVINYSDYEMFSDHSIYGNYVYI